MRESSSEREKRGEEKRENGGMDGMVAGGGVFAGRHGMEDRRRRMEERFCSWAEGSPVPGSVYARRFSF